MDSPGHITELELLYEGNWGEWLDKMDEIMGLYFPNHCCLFCEDGEDCKLTSMKPLPTSPINAVHLLAANISPALLHKVPQDDLQDVQTLLHRLRRLACDTFRKFRFFDLPAEIRDGIYHLLSPRGRYPFILRHCGKSMIYRRPLITRTSRQFRSETLPITFKNVVFKLDFSHGRKEQAPTSLVIMNTVKSWASNYLKSFAGYLTSVSLVFSRIPPVTVTFTFSKEHGLAVRCDGRLAKGVQAAIRDQVKAIEVTRVVLDLRGEFIIMAILNNPKLRQPKHLLGP